MKSSYKNDKYLNFQYIKYTNFHKIILFKVLKDYPKTLVNIFLFLFINCFCINNKKVLLTGVLKTMTKESINKNFILKI